jgi:hypothetical protein
MVMDKEEVRRKIEEAKTLVGGDTQDPLTQIAFGEVLRMLLQQYSQPSVSQTERKTALAAQSVQISEFLAQRKIESENDRVATILYYHLHNGRGSSTNAEILEAYATARFRRPTNLSDVIARCIRKGHVIEAREKKDGQKAWQITVTGEKYVEEQLTP